MTTVEQVGAGPVRERGSAHRRSGVGRRSLRDWVVDVVLFVVSLLSGAGVVAEVVTATVSAPAGWRVAADLIGGLVACLALWGRRRWPVHVAVLTALLSMFSTSSVIAVAAALFTVAVHRPRRTLAAVTALNVLATCVYGWVWPDPTLSYLASIAFSLVVIAALVAWGMFVRARRQLALSEREQLERAQAEQRLLIEQARQHERTRIAREMHDVLAHRISLLSLHAGALEFRPDAAPADVARAAAVIRESAHQALQDLREILGVLRADQTVTPQSRPQPTLADLPALVDESRAAGA
ncbi:MAG TPA: histidine kinase dimerization/phosphoacceptor domain-containing protein, partial [Actinomycetales bacterium]